MRKLQLPLIVALVLTFGACKKEKQLIESPSLSDPKLSAAANAQLLSFSLNN